MKITGEYYAAPKALFGNTSQEMSHTRITQAATESGGAASEEEEEALSIADDDQQEPGLLSHQPGIARPCGVCSLTVLAADPACLC